jgi:hypothetical protein
VVHPFEQLSYTGSALNPDASLIAEIPTELAQLLADKNGFIIWGGGFHLRGIVDSPNWHSLEWAWKGNSALWRLFGEVRESDLPFAEDCLGDQFILRDGQVHKLRAEDGHLDNLGLPMGTFLKKAIANENGLLGLEPLLEFQRRGRKLEPGNLISVYPPFISAEAKNGVSMEPERTERLIAFLADFAKQISGVQDGGHIKVVVKGKQNIGSKVLRFFGL